MIRDNSILKIYKIYKITFPGGEVYIGLTKRSLEERWLDGYSGCNKMYAAVQKYGKNNPNIKKEIILDQLAVDEANYYEKYYITYYRTAMGFDMVLNEQDGGIYGFSLTKEAKEKISKAGKEHYKNNPDRAKKHSENMKQYYIDHPEMRDKMSEFGKRVHEKYPELCKATCKKIKQYSYDMKYIASYNSLREASIATGINEITISGCLNQPDQYTAGGFRWFYDDGKKYPLIYYRKHDVVPIAIIQKDKDTRKIIAKYSSILEASKVTGIPRSNIERVLNPSTNSKTAGGFIWEKD